MKAQLCQLNRHKSLHVIFKTLATVAALQNRLIVKGLLVTRKRQRWQGKVIFAQKVGYFASKKRAKRGRHQTTACSWGERRHSDQR